MKVYEELSLRGFIGWGGAKDTIDTILKAGKEEEFQQLIDEVYPDGLSSTELNDLLWFDDEWIFEMLEMEEE